MSMGEALLTGSGGCIGGVLRAAWPARFTAFDLPEHDARDRDALIAAARNHDTVVHLAWNTRVENFRSGALAPENLVMTHHVLEAAVASGVGRVVLASSVHADAFWPPVPGGLDPSRPPTPDSPYGASKVFIEALGRHFAVHRGIEVVAVRFGGVNRHDAQPAEASERSVWLPHRDCLDLIEVCLTAPLSPMGFALVVGVGDTPHRVHGYGTNPIWPPPR